MFDKTISLLGGVTMITKNFRLRSFTVISALLVMASLILSACAPAAQVPVTAATDTAAPTKPAATATTAPTATQAVSEPTIKVVNDPKLGKILVDDKGMTLYIYTKDVADKSNCAAGCLANWPPLLTAGSPKAGDGVDASKLGSTDLGDGRKIVTYNHMPLYYWVKDTKPGDTAGQNVGKVWYVLSPDGTVIKDVAAVPTTAPAATSGEPTIKVVSDPKYGKILVDDKGMTLYIYTKDVADKSNCAAGCLANWPPLLTEGSPKAGDGVDASKLGSTALADGRKIVTYNHMPLYYWVKDTKPGDTTGQNVGKVWFVLSPDGNIIKDAVATPAASSNSDTGYGNSSSSSSTASSEPTISVVTDPKLGKILVDEKGMTLYIYTKDAPDMTNCSDQCMAAWPPLLSLGSPKAGDGVDASKLSTITLPDGRKMVTYDHKPLYYWVKDAKPGDTTGQNVGGVWYVLAPDGSIVK
jgi:predicted lipoprotein with Yx(FWY)xxD motif